MEALTLQNIRCFNNTGEICIKPFTLLLGGNSTGKSSFLRFFGLLKQSIEAKSRSPFLWYGDIVDFGGYNEVINNTTNDNKIIFACKFRIPYDDIIFEHFYYYNRSAYFYSYDVSENEYINITAKFTISEYEKKEEESFVEEVTFNIFDHTITYKFDQRGKITLANTNGFDITSYYEEYKIIQTGLIPHFINTKGKIDNYAFANKTRFNQGIHEYIFGVLKNWSHRKISEASVRRIIASTKPNYLQTMYNNITTHKSNNITLKNYLKRKEYNNLEFYRLASYIVALYTSTLFDGIGNYFSSLAANIYYIAPVRATAERYYRPQSLSINKVDPQGRNLPMFVRNLSESELKDFQEWTASNFGFYVNITYSGGHISLLINECNNSKEINIADMGFGYSQILPILTQIWSIIRKYNKTKKRNENKLAILAIEQPELHLHPKLQAQLTDIFIFAIKEANQHDIDLRIILETHSEHIVNRFGHRISNKELTANDLNVVLFEKHSSDSSTDVKFASFNEHGFLEKWPIGFLDPDIIEK